MSTTTHLFDPMRRGLAAYRRALQLATCHALLQAVLAGTMRAGT